MTKWTEKKIATHTKWSGIGSTGKHTGQPIGQGAAYSKAGDTIPRLKGHQYKYNFEGLRQSVKKIERRISRQQRVIADLKTAKGEPMRRLRAGEISKLNHFEAILKIQLSKLKARQLDLVPVPIKKLSDMPL